MYVWRLRIWHDRFKFYMCYYGVAGFFHLTHGCVDELAGFFQAIHVFGLFMKSRV